MRLSGWLRLWVVLAALWAVPVALLGYDTRPKVESVRSAWTYAATEAIAAKTAEAEGRSVSGDEVRDFLEEKYPTTDALIAWLEKVEKPPKTSQLIFHEEVSTINAEYRRKIAEHPSKVRAYAFNAFLIWLVPLLFILGLGYAVGWIWRGFRPRTDS